MKAKSMFLLSIGFTCAVYATVEFLCKSYLTFGVYFLLSAVLLIWFAKEILRENEQRKFYRSTKTH